LGYLRMGPRNILEPLLGQAALEEQSLGAPAKKTLLEIAEMLVRWALTCIAALVTPQLFGPGKDCCKGITEKI